MAENLVIIVLVGIIAAMALALGLRKRRPSQVISMHSGMERVREIGHLSAFKVFTKEIVTQSKHDWGDIGSRYLSWILTDKKMAMIFEFEIDCRYDLRHPDLNIQEMAGGRFTLKMPACTYEVHLKDINFYDEQQPKLLPWLLPDLVNGFFSKGFTEEDKNRIVSAAKQQAEGRARSLIRTFLPSVEQSAQGTLRAICTSFGAREINFVFKREEQPEVNVVFQESVAA